MPGSKVPELSLEIVDTPKLLSELRTNPLVWALVLHWRGLEYTRACLQSLRATPYGNFKLLLVDNGSQAGDGTVLLSEFPEVTVLRLGENKGFAGGCNAGIDYCLQNGAQFVWLLNNDTMILGNCLDSLLKVALNDERIGACGPALLASSNSAARFTENNSPELTDKGERIGTSNQVASHNANGSLIETGNSCGRGVVDFRRGKTFLKSYLPKDPIECDWLSGASLLLSAQAIKKAGVFDERYFLYFEDTELCARLRKLGFKCVLVPSAQVVHAGGSSTQGELEHWRAYYYTRNRLLFFMNYCPIFLKPLAFVLISAHIVRHAIALPFKGKNGRNKLRAELLGVRDYLLGRFGQATCLDWYEPEDIHSST